jgi:hypothetical protein
MPEDLTAVQRCYAESHQTLVMRSVQFSMKYMAKQLSTWLGLVALTGGSCALLYRLQLIQNGMRRVAILRHFVCSVWPFMKCDIFVCRM